MKSSTDFRASVSKNLTRRQLLKGAAAIAAPVFIPGRVLGAEGSTPSGSRITFGLIGCGGMGGSDTTQLFNTGEAQLVAVCDVDRSKREERKARFEKMYAEHGGGTFKGITAYADFRDLLARDDMDAVVIATPDHWHAVQVVMAAGRGKDIYCEKPLSLTIREGRAMVDAVRKHNRVLQVGSQQRSDARFRHACELVRNGAIGRVQSVFVRVGGPSGECALPEEATPEGLDWSMWIGPAPYRGYHPRLHPAGWRAYRDYSGGGVTDWGAHHFDIAQWALGMDESGPVEVIPADGKEHPVLTFRYESGVRMYHVWGPGAKDVQWPSPPQGDNGITFAGDKGWIEVDRSHIRTSPENLATMTFGPKDERLFVSPGHHRNWIHCIRTRERPLCDVETGCRSVTVCHLANLAYRLNRPIRWDPAREQIVGDDEAAARLDRSHREPWAL